LLAAGVDQAAVRRFISRERSLTLDSANRPAVALGLSVVREARSRRAARNAAEFEARVLSNAKVPAVVAPEPEAGMLTIVNLSAVAAHEPDGQLTAPSAEIPPAENLTKLDIPRAENLRKSEIAGPLENPEISEEIERSIKEPPARPKSPRGPSRKSRPRSTRQRTRRNLNSRLKPTRCATGRSEEIRETKAISQTRTAFE
jgi:hypothetical protein